MKYNILFGLILTILLTGCGQGDERLAEKARIEGKESAKSELQVQIEAKDQLVEKAREEGKAQAEAALQVQIGAKDQLVEKARDEGRAQAEAELKVQMENVDKLKQKAYAEGKSATEADFATQKENMDFLIEKARTEGKVQAEAELKAQNENLTTKAQEMELDLATRNKFYQALNATYEGTFATEKGDFNIRITLVPSLPPYDSGRTRSLEEVTSDLINLHFNAQIIQWNPKSDLGAVGCRIEHIRPDVTTGEISIASESCKNLYSIKLAGLLSENNSNLKAGIGSVPETEEEKKKLSRKIALGIKTGKLLSVPVLTGKLQPTTNAKTYQFSVERVTQ